MLPFSSQTTSRAPLSSLAVSRAPLQFPNCITCYHTVPKIYHVPPYPLRRDLEREIIFIFIVCYTFIDFTLRGGGGGGVHPDYFVKLDFVIAVDQLRVPTVSVARETATPLFDQFLAQFCQITYALGCFNFSY